MLKTSSLSSTTPSPWEAQQVDRMLRLVRCRWVVGAGIILGSLLARLGWGMPLDSPVYAVGPAVLLYNALFYVTLRRRGGGSWLSARAQLHIQFILDQVTLAWLAHLSGGSGSPLLPLFAVWAVLSASFLARREALLQAGLTVALLAGVAFLERTGFQASSSPPGSVAREVRSPILLGAVSATQFIAVFLAASASDLRTREWRIARLQQDLTEAYRRLEEMDGARAQFVLTLTHELRSPVAAVESLLKALPYAGDLPEKARELVERANQRASALTRLVNDLLEVARERHDFGKGGFQSMRLDKVLQDVLAAHQGQAITKGVALEASGLEEEIPFSGDREAIERLFGNLVDNAVKYTPGGGRVTVRAAVAGGRPGGRSPDSSDPKDLSSQGGRWVEVQVADTGMGIPAGSLGRLFEEFYRAPNAKQAVAQGTGLGLTICSRVAEQHGGRIGVESRANVGSTFTVWLPWGAEPG